MDKTILWTTSSFSYSGFPAGYKVIGNPYKRKLKESELINLISEHHPVGIIAGVEPYTEAVFSAYDGLKVVSRCGVGTDAIDFDAASRHGVVICNTPLAPVESVAQLAVACAFALARKLGINTAKMMGHKWEKSNGVLLCGKTIGIIGCGRIGTRVAELFSALGCKVLGYDPFISSHNICTMVTLEELLGKSDFVSLHLSFNEKTANLINEKTISLMKKDAYLINTARGGLVNENALYDALKDGRLAGAALDVFPEEPYSGKLCDLDCNLILTPHIASSTKEGRATMERQAAENLFEALEKIDD